MRYDRGMEKNGVTILMFGTAVMLVLILLYVGAYLSLLIIHYPGENAVLNEHSAQLVRDYERMPHAEYRIGGATAKTVFAPAEAIDRRLRPAIWDQLKLFKEAGVLRIPLS